MKILKECCITAMDKFFEKKNVTEGLEELKKMGLVTQVTESFQDMLITRNQSKGELEIEFKATADGIIYTKKIIRAHSKSALRLHGMEQGRVQFPVGPQ